MIKDDMIYEKLTYDDISIVPDVISNINHRLECDCYIDGMLPIFAAPMSTVISEDNWKYFCENKINVVIPRNISLKRRFAIMVDYSEFKEEEQHYKPFVSLSLSEAMDIFLSDDKSNEYTKMWNDFVCKHMAFTSPKFEVRICIDLANGHMKSLLDTIKSIKGKYFDSVKIMSGNIAHPKTYELYDNAGCDYVRASIGTGSGCTTASNVGVYYPPFSLIKECYELKKSLNGKCQIIADGGIDCYRNVQKALLYADYVMIGGLFNQCIESASPAVYKDFHHLNGKKTLLDKILTFCYKGKTIKASDYDDVMKDIKNGNVTVIKKFYGMSTKIAQAEIKGCCDVAKQHLKTSEGRVTENVVLFDLPGWVDNETSYLRSAMSYTNSKTLKEYKDSQWVKIKQRKYNA